MKKKNHTADLLKLIILVNLLLLALFSMPEKGVIHTDPVISNASVMD